MDEKNGKFSIEAQALLTGYFPQGNEAMEGKDLKVRYSQTPINSRDAVGKGKVNFTFLPQLKKRYF